MDCNSCNKPERVGMIFSRALVFVIFSAPATVAMAREAVVDSMSRLFDAENEVIN